MLLLLDAHLSPVVASELRKRGVDVEALRDWQGGRYHRAPDQEILAAARAEKRTLVTFDCRTVPPLLKGWAASGQSHEGVVLVDEKTIRPDDFGGLVRALLALVEAAGESEWRDRVEYLKPGA